jgi:hypothetical protein
VAFYRVCLDESDSHDGAPALCVAAYLFEKDACDQLDIKWKSVLDEYELPYFHMVDCVHLKRPFDKLARDQSIDVEKKVIAIISEHMLLGAAITVNEKDYNNWAARKELGTAYSYCCWQTIVMVNARMDERKLDGEIAYFFEVGHESAGETHAIMEAIVKNPRLKKSYRHASVC